MSTTGFPVEVSVALIGLDGVDVVLGEHGEDEQEPDDDHRDHRVEDLDGDVLVELPGHLVGALPVADDRPQDQQAHRAADDDAGGHHARVELEGLLALLGGAPAGAIARVDVASGQDQGRPDGQRRTPSVATDAGRAGRLGGRSRLADGSDVGDPAPRGGGGEPVVNAFTAMTLVGTGAELEVERRPALGPANSQFRTVARRPDGPVRSAVAARRRPDSAGRPREHPVGHGRRGRIGPAGEHRAPADLDARVVGRGQPGQLGQVPGQAQGGVVGPRPAGPACSSPPARARARSASTPAPPARSASSTASDRSGAGLSVAGLPSHHPP